MDRHPIIGDIRGHGLFIGVDLVKDRKTREPHTKAAEHVVSRFREEKILMQRDGPFENVLKMKPPMKFSKENVDHFVSNYLESIHHNNQFHNVITKKSDSSLQVSTDKKLIRQILVCLGNCFGVLNMKSALPCKIINYDNLNFNSFIKIILISGFNSRLNLGRVRCHE